MKFKTKRKKLEAMRKENNTILMHQSERISKLEKQVEELTDILLEANIIEDIDMSDVKYRSKQLESWFGFPQTVTVPYIVNEAKVK